MDSILESVKKKVGVLNYDTHFDDEIIMDINTTFFMLNQLGIGPKDPFTISDATTTWDEFECEHLDIVKTYIPLNVRLLFDPPTSSAIIETINAEIKRYEFYMMCDKESIDGVYVDKDTSVLIDEDETNKEIQNG